MGQICTATSRIYVQSAIYDEFIERFIQYTKETSVIGSQFDGATTHGPQVSKIQHEKIMQYIDSAKSEGAQLVLGGAAKSGPGYFIEPTIFKDASNSMKVVREEIFGPFVVIQPFDTEEEAVQKANDTDYGLGAAVFTRDVVRAHRVAGAIEAGMVWVKSQISWLCNPELTVCFSDKLLSRFTLCHSFRWL